MQDMSMIRGEIHFIFITHRVQKSHQQQTLPYRIPSVTAATTMIQRRGFIDADLRGKVDRTHKQWAFKAYFVYFSVWRGLL